MISEDLVEDPLRCVDHGDGAAGGIARRDRGTADDWEVQVVGNCLRRVEDLAAAHPHDASGAGADGFLFAAFDLRHGTFPAKIHDVEMDLMHGEGFDQHGFHLLTCARAGDEQRVLREAHPDHFLGQCVAGIAALDITRWRAENCQHWTCSCTGLVDRWGFVEVYCLHTLLESRLTAVLAPDGCLENWQIVPQGLYCK